MQTRDSDLFRDARWSAGLVDDYMIYSMLETSCG
jgi:hypothetical protein